MAQRSVFYGHHFIEEPEQSLVYVYGVVDEIIWLGGNVIGLQLGSVLLLRLRLILLGTLSWY